MIKTTTKSINVKNKDLPSKSNSPKGKQLTARKTQVLFDDQVLLDDSKSRSNSKQGAKKGILKSQMSGKNLKVKKPEKMKIEASGLSSSDSSLERENANNVTINSQNLKGALNTTNYLSKEQKDPLS